jgi:hypothetical protein
MMGIPFSIITRGSNDKYIDSNLRNVLSELPVDLENYGTMNQKPTKTLRVPKAR